MKYMQVLRDENKDGISKCSNYQSQRVKNGEGMSKKYKSHQCTPKHQGQKSLGKKRQAWLCIPVNPALRRQQQGDLCDF